MAEAAGKAANSLSRRLSRHWALVLALAFLAVIALAAILAPWVSPHDPLVDLGVGRSAGIGTPGAVLGTDNQGRDILSRIIWGGRISVVVALVPVLVSTLISVGIGIAAGVLGGWTDWLIMRVLDIFFA
ncbi:MAG: ABC transporter permease, partial [Parvibaculaceae bacterium]